MADTIDDIDVEEDNSKSRKRMKYIKVVIKLIIAAMMYACWSGLLSRFFNIMVMASFVGFAWLTYRELKEGNFITMILILMGTLLLNPVYPMYFNVGMQFAIYLILSIMVFASGIFDLFKPKPDYENTKFGL